MKKNIELLFSGALAAGLLLQCGPAFSAQDDFGLNGRGAASFSGAPVPAASRPSAVRPASAGAPKDWTVMVFMNGKNNVQKYAELNLKEMEQVGSTGRMNVVVEIGRLHQGSQRLLVEKTSGNTVNDVLLSNNPNADMGDYRDAVDFIKFAKANYPARHYMFILWNHGLGWLDPIMKGGSDKGISFDDDTHDYIRTPQMGEIFREAGPVDVYAANACLMQMAETAYEVKDYVKVIIGSEETMLAVGFDYADLLGYINANPDVSPRDIGARIVGDWRKFMNAYPQIAKVPGTMSALDPAAVGELPSRLDAFAGAVMASKDTAAVDYAIANVIRFTSIAGDTDTAKALSTYGDLYDFVRLVSEKTQDQAVKAAGRGLMDFIANRLVLSYTGVHVDAQGQDYSRARGISINLTMKRKLKPGQFDSILETKYGDLALARASRWGQFLDWTDQAWAASPN